MLLREPANSLTHFAGLLLAIPAAAFLLRFCRGDRTKVAGMFVYGFSLILCYTGSGLYHSVPESYVEEFARLDHIGIYTLIAGTVTPIGLVLLRGRERLLMVGGIWLLAGSGITLRLFGDPHLAVRTLFYLFMGWIGCALYRPVLRRISWARLRPMLYGGIFYSVGAAINLVPFPDVIQQSFFGPHAVFHLFVIAGSACHYYFMMAVLIPYRRVPALAAPEPLVLKPVAVRVEDRRPAVLVGAEGS